MAKFHFAKHPGVISAPLSFIGWSGDLKEEEKSGAGLVIAEYNVICGDIGTDTSTRDARLADLRKELQEDGHEIVIEELNNGEEKSNQADSNN